MRDAALLEFLDRVYGPYLPRHRYAIREFIAAKNPRLYRAIRAFGFDRLPQLEMPSRGELLRELVKRAAEGDYATMTTKEKRAVQWAAHRSRP